MRKNYRLPFRRRREGKTNYFKRLKLLYSERPRLVVRKTNKQIIAQIVNFNSIGDKTLAYFSSLQLKKYGWHFSFKNLPAAYLTGLKIGKICLKKGIEEAILDIGLNTSTKGNRIYSAVKGALDAGLKVPVNKNVLPSEERIKGFHIKNYLPKFEKIVEKFEEVKRLIENE